MVIVPLLVLLGVILAAAASFFFSLAETALFSLGKWQVRILTEQSPRRGARVAALLASPQDLLATIALGNTVASCLMLGLALWMVLAGHWPFVVTLILVLVLALVAGEVLPKTFAVREPERWALIVAGPLSVVMVFTGPLHRLAQAVNEKVLSLVIPKNLKPLPGLTDDDYAELLEVATHQGVLAASEKDVLVRIIGLDRRTVKEVMKPRARISFISDDLTVPEMVEAARKARHRRIPMYDETPDTIVGVLNTRALLLNPDVDLSEVIEFPSFVPASMNLLLLLKSLQKQQRGLAIVVDEYGGTAGIVTLEDIIEELVGNIRAEGEAVGFAMEVLGPGRWRVNGTTRVDQFRLDIPEFGDISGLETMGGLVTHLCEVVPATGTVVTHGPFQLTVQVADERRVREVLVERMSSLRGKGGTP